MGTYTYEYARPSLTADCVVFCHGAEALEVLLIERKFEPFKGCWALPGGFINMDEDAETAAKRELYEETGIIVGHVEQCGAFSDVNRDPRDRVVTIAYYALVDKTEAVAADDARKAEWFPSMVHRVLSGTMMQKAMHTLLILVSSVLQMVRR